MSVTFVMTVGLRIYADLLVNLVLSRTFTFLRITTLENPVALVLSNLWILRMLLMPNIIWMVKFFLVGSSLLFLLKRIERSQLR